MLTNFIHFYKTPALLKIVSKDLIWNIPTEEKIIYLTFDDGPIPELTDYILDTLDTFNAKATFFCVGDNIYKYPEICKKIPAKGHLLGNHTFNHLKGWNISDELYFENIKKCQQHISEIQASSQKPLFRPPHGQITKKQIRLLREQYHIIMWNILSYDFENVHSPQKSLDRIIKKTKPGSIVVFHDNYKAENKMKYMLPRFLEYFQKKGFSFRKMNDESMAID